jgi:hypothetical protein
MTKFLFPVISLFALVICHSVNAQPATSSNTSSPATNITTPPTKGCKLAQTTQTPAPSQVSATVEPNTMVGKVYGVVGDIVMIELDNKTTRHMGVRRSEVGYMRSLIGSRIACNLT